MKAIELLKYLVEVVKNNPEANVVLYEAELKSNTTDIDFNTDDVGDVEIYVVANAKPY